MPCPGLIGPGGAGGGSTGAGIAGAGLTGGGWDGMGRDGIGWDGSNCDGGSCDGANCTSVISGNAATRNLVGAAGPLVCADAVMPHAKPMASKADSVENFLLFINRSIPGWRYESRSPSMGLTLRPRPVIGHGVKP